MHDELMLQAYALVKRRKPGECERGLLHAGPVEVYCRVGERVLAGKGLLAFVLADITVAPEARRQGRLRALLHDLELEFPELGVQALVVENVGNPHLHAALLRWGYQPAHPGGPQLFPTLFKTL